ncbi:TonB-dependent receptor [Halobacteriovorax sp. BALOs_7]|uniref:TonB-dependent receptor n=1 Tax=Halobacteriovorax sp. BALOs_7 TaxID=2109558 RepID=UPI000EA2DD4E|nr:TonB-dependent receptor [Halobacteriovorax sp. BALOs_7]AYF43839.1 TonB-dependent receptor [Halobacteriovorax sp. BALOs_7]
MRLLFVVLFSLITTAQTKNDAIYIYGTLIEKDYYSDSNSTSVRQAKDIQKSLSTDMSEAFKIIPNLNTANGSSRSSFFQIRGIGERSAYEAISNYSVGVMVDEVDYTGISGITNLNGLSQIEVFRGPQATDFGPSAMAGMIHLKSQDPTIISKTKTYLSYESFNTFEEALSYTGMLSTNTGMSISFNKRDSDGFMKNEYLNRTDTNGQDELALRASLRQDFYDSTLTLGLHYFDKNNGYDAFTQDNSYTTRSDKPGKDKSETFSQYLKFEKEFNANLMSTTIFTHIKNDSFYSYDEDWGNNPYWNSLPGYNADYDYNIKFPRSREDFSLDQRFNISNQSTFGIYIKSSDEDFKEVGYEDGNERKNIQGDIRTELASVYAQRIHDLNNKLSLEYGLRGEFRKVDYKENNSGSNSNIHTEDLMYGFNISISKKDLLGELAYLKIAKGYKPGGINTQSAVPQNRKEFKPESLYSLEVGQKAKLDDSRISLSTALFFMYREDAQVKTSFQDDPMDPSSFTFYTDNATSGINYGAELEASYKQELGFNALWSIGLLNTRYRNYNIGTRNLNGRQMPHAPNYQINLNLEYKFKSGAYIGGNLFASDDFYFSNSHDLKSRPYQLVDAKIGYRNESLDISIWSKNVFDENYSLRGFYFANMPPTWQDELYTQREAPRSFGITGRYIF